MRILSRYPSEWIVVARWLEAERVVFSSPSIFACLAYKRAHDV